MPAISFKVRERTAMTRAVPGASLDGLSRQGLLGGTSVSGGFGFGFGGGG
jgi:hypothetical protein